MLPDWIHNMPSTLEDRGCEMIDHKEVPPLDVLARAWTDNMLLVWRGLVYMMPETPVPLPPGMGLPETLSRESFAEMLRRAIEETKEGAALGMDYHVFLARKAR